MKNFTQKRKRDGQGWKKIGIIYASDWQDAKQQFTDAMRSWMNTQDGCAYIGDDDYEEMRSMNHKSLENIEYSGPGYYNVSCGWMSPDRILDTDLIDTFCEDVYTDTIKRI